MSNTTYAFTLTILAGLSTMIGTIILFFKTKNKNNIIVSSLAFAAGVMLCLSLIELIPEGYRLINKKYNIFASILVTLIFINIGVIISSMIAKITPDKNNNKLYKVGIISMIAIIIHNLPEGIATFLATNNDRNIGLSLAIAIALHNIPEGISISVPIYYASKSKSKAFFYTFISALSEPLGAFLAFIFLKPFVTNTVMGMLFSFIAGIMMHISCKELLIEAVSYNKKGRVVVFFLIGVLFMVINEFIF
jgi:Predicted divalent heavy-metal cations transporter